MTPQQKRQLGIDLMTPQQKRQLEKNTTEWSRVSPRSPN
jgi:hypothetical protein